MKRQVFFIMLASQLLPARFCFSQNRNKVLFDVGFVVLTPLVNPVTLKREPHYAEEENYNLKSNFLVSPGFKIAMGYEFHLKTKNKSSFNLPFLFSYKLIQESANQSGYYDSGGISGNNSFGGDRIVTLSMNAISISLGLNYTSRSVKEDEWGLDFFLSQNMGFLNRGHETISRDKNCLSCRSGSSNFSYTGFNLYWSADLKLSRLFKVHHSLLGPFIAYHFNHYFDHRSKKFGYDKWELDNPAYSLKFFLYLETGIKIKIK